MITTNLGLPTQAIVSHLLCVFLIIPHPLAVTKRWRQSDELLVVRF